MDELELILTDICACSRVELYGDASAKVLNEQQLQRLEGILKLRARAVPVQYGLGYADFMGLVLKVNRHVLIPRPETEQLVEYVLQLFAQKKPTSSPCRILDIGTGSGCIAIALAKFIKQDVAIAAIDISAHALSVASDNAKAHAVQKRIRFFQSDLFNHAFFKQEGAFDLIVSNPPYVPTAHIGMFDTTTLSEPRVALDGGSDGCEIYRRLNRETHAYLKKDGLLISELGDGQAPTIRKIFSEDWIIDTFIKDYRGIERICVMRPQGQL